MYYYYYLYIYLYFIIKIYIKVCKIYIEYSDCNGLTFHTFEKVKCERKM